MKSFLMKSYRSNIRALYAVMKKELLVYSRYRQYMFFAIVSPLFTCLGATAMYWMFTGPSRSSPTLFETFTGTDNYAAFVFLGFLVVFYFNHTVWRVSYGVRSEQEQGTLESNFLCPTRPVLLILGKALAFAILSSFSAAIIFLLGWSAVDLYFEIANASFIPMTLILVFVTSFGFGLFISGVVMLYRQVDSIVSFFVMLQYTFCGYDFALAAVPSWIRNISYLLPATWGVEALRGILIYGLDTVSILKLILTLAGFACLYLFLGFFFLVRLERTVKRRGGLGAY